MIIYEGTNNFVSGAFLKCFSIVCVYYQHRYDPSPKRYAPLYDQDSDTY